MSQFDYSAESSDDYSLDSYSQWLEENPWSFDMIDSFLPQPDNELQNAQNTSLAGFAPESSTPQYALGQYAPGPTPMMMGGTTAYPSQLPTTRNPYTEGPSSSAGFASGSSTPQYALGQYAPAPPPMMMGGATAYPSQLPISYESYPLGPFLQNDGWPLPALENSWDNSPVSELSTELPTPPSGSPIDNAWLPVVEDFWGQSMSLQNYLPAYPPPQQNGMGMTHAIWDVYRHSTVNSSLFNDEEISDKHIRFGLPTSAAQQHTSKVGAGYYPPYTPQTQSGGNDDASRGAGKGKRKAEDSPEVVDNDKPSRKRARHVVRSICFTPPITCNPVPAPETQQTLGRNGHWGGKQPTGKALQFFEHVGSVDSKGTAKTRKAKMEAQFPVNTFQVAFAPTRPGTMPMHRSCGMGLERQQSRATVQAAPSASSGAGSSRKVANSRRL